MTPTAYYVIHVFSVIMLTAVTFSAFANPDPERRKKVLMGSGILSFLVLLGGFGLLARVYENKWEGWAIVKVVIWLALSAMAGIAYRAPGKAQVLKLVTAFLILTAVVMVYAKPL